MFEALERPIEVTLNEDGEPDAFVLDRFEYEIHGQPQVTFTRTPWWEQAAPASPAPVSSAPVSSVSAPSATNTLSATNTASRVPGQLIPDRIDTELWSVDAARELDQQDLTRYDLRRDTDGAWYLAAAWR